MFGRLEIDNASYVDKKIISNLSAHFNVGMFSAKTQWIKMMIFEKL